MTSRPRPAPPAGYMDQQQAAAYTNRDTKELVRLRRSGKLTAYGMPSDRHRVLFRVADLDALRVESHAEPFPLPPDHSAGTGPRRKVS